MVLPDMTLKQDLSPLPQLGSCLSDVAATGTSDRPALKATSASQCSQAGCFLGSNNTPPHPSFMPEA